MASVFVLGGTMQTETLHQLKEAAYNLSLSIQLYLARIETTTLKIKQAHHEVEKLFEQLLREENNQ
jgi:hypothetical protein